MNGQIKKYIYMIVTICVVVLAGIVFIKILGLMKLKRDHKEITQKPQKFMIMPKLKIPLIND